MSERVWIPVRQVMRTDVTLVNGRISILEALKIMKRVQATCLIVEKRDEKDEYGMLSFSDIAQQVIARDRAPERVNVYEIMSKPFERVGISHAPVIENDKVVGIISYYLLVLEGLPDLD
jgi:predicted transcriptional regulator